MKRHAHMYEHVKVIDIGTCDAAAMFTTIHINYYAFYIGLRPASSKLQLRSKVLPNGTEFT